MTKVITLARKELSMKNRFSVIDLLGLALKVVFIIKGYGENSKISNTSLPVLQYIFLFSGVEFIKCLPK